LLRKPPKIPVPLELLAFLATFFTPHHVVVK